MSINELPSKAPSAAKGILDRIVMHGVDQAQPVLPKKRRAKKLSDIIDGDFEAVQPVNDEMDDGLGLGWATRVKAGYRRDRIVAKQKGFNLKDGSNELR